MTTGLLLESQVAVAGGAWHPDSQVLAEVSADHLRPQSTILQAEAQFNHSPSKLP